jgi:hypothetical protein
MTGKPETRAVQALTVPHNHHDASSTYEDSFDYSQHVPIELPVGPWDCLDRACKQYEGPDGSDLPDVTYCSHVTVLVLCSGCSGASANHAIKQEIPWGECEERRHRKTST